MSYMIGGITIVRKYVRYDDNGIRIEKNEDDFSDKELAEINKQNIETYMSSLGYVKKTTA